MPSARFPSRPLPAALSTGGRAATILLSFALCLAVASCASGVRAQDSAPALLQAARLYGKGHQPVSHPGSSLDTLPEIYSTATEEQYRSELLSSLHRKEFARLETEGRSAANGTKVSAGVWKILLFYQALSYFAEDKNTIDTDWNNFHSTMQAWIDSNPDSSTPRIILASAYLNYAYSARGSGYADTVTAAQWELFESRSAQAGQALLAAASLPQKSPYWFEALQNLSVAQGWRKDQAAELLDLAIAFEPDYYHYYREHAFYLLPKWYGHVGEAATFADQVATKVGGKRGSFIYFELASVIVCQCRQPREVVLANLNWPKVKNGYQALGELYGYSQLKNNRMAMMAFVEGDKPAARDALSRVADEWNNSVWESYDSFQKAKTWASSAGEN